MGRALFGSIAVDRRQIGNPYTRQAKLAGVTVSPQDLAREQRWQSTVISPDVLQRRQHAEALRVEREFQALAGELGATAVDETANAETIAIVASAGASAVGNIIEHPNEQQTLLV